MKKIFLLSLVCLMLLFVFGAEKNVLTYGWDPWKPMMYLDENKNLTGVDVELMQAIFKDMGYSLTPVELPYLRRDRDMQNGDLDFQSSVPYDKNYQSWAYFSKPFRTGTNILVVRKGEASLYPLKSMKDISKYKNFTLGVMRGTKGDYPAEIQNQIEEVNDNELNYKKLLAGRITAFVSGRYSAIQTIKDMKIEDKVEIHPFIVLSTDAYVIFSKQTVSKETVDKFNKSLDNIKKNGIYDKILKKYTMINLSKK